MSKCLTLLPLPVEKVIYKHDVTNSDCTFVENDLELYPHLIDKQNCLTVCCCTCIYLKLYFEKVRMSLH